MTALWPAVAVAVRLLDPQPEPPPADYALRWEAPAGCPDATTVEARIAAMTSGRPEGRDTLQVDATISEGDDGFALVLTTTLRGEAEIRRVNSGRCDSLVDTVTLVVAVSLDPVLGGVRHTVPEPTPAAVAQRPATEHPGAAPLLLGSEVMTPRPGEALGRDSPGRRILAPQRDSPERRILAPQLVLRAGLGPEFGALPTATLGTRLAVGVGWAHVRILAAGTFLVPRRSEGPEDTASLVQMGTGALIGCGRGVWGRWSMPACLGVEAGGMRATSRGLPIARTAGGPWVGPLASLGVLRKWRRVGAWADLEVVGRAVATRVIIDHNVAFSPAAVSARLWAGIEVSLP